MAALMAGESTVLPSPVAPKVRTSNVIGVAAVFFAGAAAAAARAGTAVAARPMLLSLRRSRRAEEKGVFMAWRC
jgi:hypothetical protein